MTSPILSTAKAHTISGLNRLSAEEKHNLYTRLIPHELLERFNIGEDLVDSEGRKLLRLNCEPGTSVAEMELYHHIGFQDPILYGQITDTINGQIHVLLYVLNNPRSPRFNVDRMPDGNPTTFGTIDRHLAAEEAAMNYGLSPGQIRSGLRLSGPAIAAFDNFVNSLGHEMYFVEPLYYHNAIIFERYGFNYGKGRRLMERIQLGFEPGGDLYKSLDDSTPFRKAIAVQSIRLRSWAIHDNLLGEPFTNVTMYKRIGKSAKLNTSKDCKW